MVKKIIERLGDGLDLLLSFAPWIVYNFLIGNTLLSKKIAIIVALFLTIVLNVKKLKKGFILELGTLIFFILLGVWIFILPNSEVVKYMSIITNPALATIIIFSLIVRKPFTLQYAQKNTPSFLWNTKAFLKVNDTITIAWALSFLLLTFFQISVVNFRYNASTYIIAEVLIYSVVVYFSKNYPNWYQAQSYWAYRKTLKPLCTQFLKGNFVPIQTEIFVENLTYEGEIPQALKGEYMRNGPNPQFEPFSYVYPFDGDAMIHALYFNQGVVSYRNRFVVTPELEAERRYGQAIYSSIIHPIKPDPRLLTETSNPYIKAGAFIHVIKLGQSYLAMHEAAPAYEITHHLETLGKWHPCNSQRDIPINAHTRTDPYTQSVYAISYSIKEAPYLTLYQFDQTGNLIEEVGIEKGYPTMIHDFIITKNFIIIIDSPVVFSLQEMMKGKNILQWQPELGTQIGLIPRDNFKQKPLWIKTKPFFSFHYANAFEHENCIEFIGAHYEKFPLEQEKEWLTQLTRTVIDLDSLQVDFYDLGIQQGEFMRINDQYQGQSNRYLYMLILKNDKFSQLVKYDSQTKEKLVRDFGGYELSEPVFVAEKDAKFEDDGYLIFFAYHTAADSSEFYILKAQDFLAKPQAIIKMPQRVPNGLHGNFFPGG